MKRLLILVACVLVHFSARAQIDSITHNFTNDFVYWFDQDYSTRQNDTIRNGMILIDVANLSRGQHTIYIQFGSGDAAQLHSYIFSNLIFPQFSIAPDNNLPDISHTYTNSFAYWYDEDYSSLGTDTIRNGILLLDVAHLNSGDHRIYIQMGNGDAVQLNSFEFSNLYLPQFSITPDSTLPHIEHTYSNIFVYWFDHDYANHQTDTIRNGNIRLDVSQLNPGEHTVYIQFGNGDAAQLHSYKFSNLIFPQIQIAEFHLDNIDTGRLKLVYWFEGEDNHPARTIDSSAGTHLINVPSLACGEQTIKMFAYNNAGYQGPVVNRNFIMMDSSCCLPPQLVTVDSIGGTSSRIHWEYNRQENFTLAFYPHPFNPDTATNTITLTDASYHISGLDSGYTYYYAVKTNCDSSVNPWVTGSWRTICRNIVTTDTVVCDQMLWRGMNLIESGHYADTVVLSDGVGTCDSIYRLQLFLQHSTADTQQVVACRSYQWNGQHITESGKYIHHTVNFSGCDRTITLQLTVNQPTHPDSVFVETACGQYIWHDEAYRSSGQYIYNRNYDDSQCPSIDTLQLTIHPNYSTHDTVMIFEGEIYSYHGNNYSQAGTHTESFQSIHGCDSIFTLELITCPHLVGTSWMQPADGGVITQGNIDLSWNSVSGAEQYAVYIWKSGDAEPSQPTYTTGGTQYTFSNYDNQSSYHWKVVAMNQCDTAGSATLLFSINKQKTVAASSDSIVFAETRLNATSSRSLRIDGIDLTDSIGLTLHGSDAQHFTVQPAALSRRGGTVTVTFAPTALQENFEAYLVTSSDTANDTVALSGSLADFYIFTATVSDSIMPAETPVPISGSLHNALGAAVANKAVDVHVTVMGHTFVMSDTTDSQGQFAVTYTPRQSECGYYEISATFHGKERGNTLATFNIPGITFGTTTPVLDVALHDTVWGAMAIRNRCGVSLHGISMSCAQPPEGMVIHFDTMSLAPFQSDSLHYYVTGTTLSTGNQFLNIRLNTTCEEGPIGHLMAYYYCYRPIPDLQIAYDTILCAAVPGLQRVVDMPLYNNTDSTFRDVHVVLPDGQTFIQIVLADSTFDIAPHDSLFVPLLLSFPQGTPLVPVTGSIAVHAENTTVQYVPYVINLVSNAKGSLRVLVSNEFTYYNNGPYVEGAHVSVVGYYSLDTVAQGITGPSGELIFDSIPEGYYRFTVDAPNNDLYQSIIQIHGGEQNFKDIILSYQAVSYSWRVYQKDEEDNWGVTLNTEYQTNVPKPVLTLETPPINVPYDGSMGSFNLIITNHGLIDAYDAEIEIPSTSLYEFFPLFDRIDTIHALSSVIVPCGVRDRWVNEKIEHIRAGAKYYIDTIYNVTERALTRIEYYDTVILIPVTSYETSDDSLVWIYDTTMVMATRHVPDTVYDSVLSHIVYRNALTGNVLFNIDMINQLYSNNDPAGSMSGAKGGAKGGGTKASFERTGECEYTFVRVGAQYRCSNEGKRVLYANTLDIITLHTPCGSDDLRYIANNSWGGSYGIGDSWNYHNYGFGYWYESDRLRDHLNNIHLDLPQLQMPEFRMINPSEWECTPCGIRMASRIMGCFGYDPEDDITNIGKDPDEILNDFINQEPELDWDDVEEGLEALEEVTKNRAARKAIKAGRNACKWRNKLECPLGLLGAAGYCVFGWNEDITGESQAPTRGLAKNTAAKSVTRSQATDYYTELYNNNLRLFLRYLETAESDLFRVLNDTLPVYTTNPEILSQIVDYLDNTDHATVQGLSQCYDNDVTEIDTATLAYYAERWNRTILYNMRGWTKPSHVPNGLSLDFYYPDSSTVAALMAMEDTMRMKGYESMAELLVRTIQSIASSPVKKTTCAGISLQFRQDFAMTREAFEGTLTITNPHETASLRDLQTVFMVTDSAGHDQSDRFDIAIMGREGIDLTDNSIAPGGTGTVTVRFVPLMSAAPTDSTPYLFSGIVDYTNPYSNDSVSDVLEPVMLTVTPSPHLRLDYFIQHDIIADDPLTSPIIEPSVPATIGLRIYNDGAGVAKNVRVSTIQPQVVENRQRLSIDFRMLGTMQNGIGSSQPFSDIALGSLTSGETQTIEYYLLSPLLGTITVGDVNVIHNSSIDDRDMSLVEARAHSLMKTVLQYGAEADNIHDFLTDDTPNGLDYPDSLFFSDGTATSVNAAVNTTFDHYLEPNDTIVPDTVVQVTIIPNSIGWTFGTTEDPGNGKYEIVSCVRDDNTEIPLDNIWLTFVDLPAGLDPIYVNKLHLLDTLSVVRPTIYNVTFRPKDNLLKVDSITGLPENETFFTVDSIVVHFNKAIIDSTFSYADMSLKCNNGVELMDSSVTVSRLNDSTFSVDLAHKQHSYGLYVLKVYADSIVDAEGRYGISGISGQWVRTCPPSFVNETQTVCDSFFWHGHTLTQSGLYADTVVTVDGCDSMFYLDLIVNHSIVSDTFSTVSIFEGESYVFNGHTYSQVGTYRDTLQSIYGCDSVFTFVLTTCPHLAAVTGLVPANDSVITNGDLIMRWDSIANADSYDIYIWKDNTEEPLEPIFSTDGMVYTFSNYDNLSSYRWKVTALNPCGSVSSTVQQFSISKQQRIVVSHDSISFGDTRINTTASRSIHIDGIDLTDSVQLILLGSDAQNFAVQPSVLPRYGGMVSLTFMPTILQEQFNAYLVASSDTVNKIIPLCGNLADFYQFDISVPDSIMAAEEPVAISGTLHNALGSVVAGKAVDIHVTVMGITTVLTDTTDAQGRLAVTYAPRPSECGYYEISAAIHGKTPGSTLADFNIPGILFLTYMPTWDVELNDTLRGSIPIRNRCNITLHNIALNANLLPNGMNIHFGNLTLAPFQTDSMEFYVVGNTLTAGDIYNEVTFSSSCTESPLGNFSAYYYCDLPVPDLQIAFDTIHCDVQPGVQKVVDVTLYNNTDSTFRNVNLTLPGGQSNIQLLRSDSTYNIAPHDTLYIPLLILFPQGSPIAPVTGTAYVSADNTIGQNVPFVVNVTSDAKGSLRVLVSNDFTYYSGGPHVNNATVKVVGYYSLDTVAQGITDISGELVFDSLTEGYYRCYVNATDNEPYSSVVRIRPGHQTFENVDLEYKPVSYSWVVYQKDIEDHYGIRIHTTYQTNVPLPVVTVDVPEFSVPGDGSFANFNIVVTNHGLIDAYNAVLTIERDGDLAYGELLSELFGSMTNYEFIPLFDEIDTLKALSSMIIPCGVRNKTAYNNLQTYLNNPAYRVEDYYRYDTVWHLSYDRVSNNVRTDTLINSTKIGVAVYNVGSDSILVTFTDENASGDCGMIRFEVNASWMRNGEPRSIYAFDEIQLAECEMEDLSFETTMEVARTLKVKNNNHFSGGSTTYDPPEEIDRFGCRPCWYTTTETLLDSAIATASRRGANIANGTGWTKAGIMASIISANPGNASMWQHLVPTIGPLFDGTANCVTAYHECNSDIVAAIPAPVNSWYQTNTPDTNIFATNVLLTQQYYDSIDALRARLSSSVAGNIHIDTSTLNTLQHIEQMAEDQGYGSVEEMYLATLDSIINLEIRQSVCVSGVHLVFEQEMAMTREAFEGKLSITNPHPLESLENLTLTFTVKDTAGNDCSNKFDIRIIGYQAMDTNGSIEPNATGIVTVRFVPLMSAAPTAPLPYLFGGTIGYTNPYTLLSMEDELIAVRLTVHPCPHLKLDYFIQHDIIADNPLTIPLIEPAIPATIGLRVLNNGNGLAKNVRLSSLQPKIVENSMGLAVEFEMTRTLKDGIQTSLPMSDVVLGNINPGMTHTLEYMLRCNLMGTITVDSVEMIHYSSIDDKDMSLVDVSAHKLIKTVLQYGNGADTIHDFLTDDIGNGIDHPDSLFFSNGAVTDVKKCNNVQFSHYVATIDTIGSLNGIAISPDTIVQVTLTPNSLGWNYGTTLDPGQGKYDIVSCIRDDNTIIPLDNIWLSFIEMPEDQDPVYVDKLHLLDTLHQLRPTTYNVTFRLKANTLMVDTITGLPIQESYFPLDSVVVHFNRPVIDSTFTYADLSLRCNNGAELMDSTVTITRLNDSTFSVHIDQIQPTAGLYIIRAFADSVMDETGHYGASGTTASWIKMPCITIHNNMTQTVCDSTEWRGFYLTQSGNYVDTVNIIENCDSVFILHLTVNRSTTATDIVTACDSIIWHGTTYLTSGNGIATYMSTNASGCDSTTTLNLTVNYSNTGIDVQNICDSIIWIDGNTYTFDNNNAQHTLTNSMGCDSLVTLNLMVKYSTSYTDIQDVCDSITWHGTTYTVSTNVPTFQCNNSAGCDSTTTLQLNIRHSSTAIETLTICDSITWHGTTYYVTTDLPTYLCNNAVGCDSTTTLHLTVNHSNTGNEVVAICDSIFSWHGETFYTSATATFTDNNASGCDSVVTLNLTIGHRTTTSDYMAACDSLVWIDGVTYMTSTDSTSVADIPTYLLTNVDGCDSIVTLFLTINHSITIFDTLMLTNSEMPYNYYGNIVEGAGNFNFDGTTSDGCDSTVLLHVIVLDGIEMNDPLTGIKVYPNPTNGMLNIDADDVLNVELLDIVGRKVTETLFKPGVSKIITLDISNLPAGTYMLHITTSQGKTLRRIVKM